MKKTKKTFTKTIQIGFDVALVDGTTDNDIKELINKIDTLINNTKKVVSVGNGINSIDYDMNEIEKMYGNYIQNKKDTTLVCENCGGTNVEVIAWIDANTNEYISEANSNPSDHFCRDCNEHITGLHLKKDHKKF